MQGQEDFLERTLRISVIVAVAILLATIQYVVSSRISFNKRNSPATQQASRLMGGRALPETYASV